MILRIKKFAVIEDGSTVVNLMPVTAGPDGSAVFGVSNEHNTDFKVGAGQTYIDRANPTFNIAVLRPSSSDVTQLETWADNQTEVYISALTLDGGFFFGDLETTTGAIKIRTNQTLSDNDVYVFEVTRETTPGFDPATGLHQSGFWAGGNLLGGYEWADADGDGVADGWSYNATSISFSSGQQTWEVGTSGASNYRKSVYLPFESEQVTVSFNIVSLTGTYSINELRLRFLDSSDTFISQATTTVSTTGRKSSTTTIPSNAVQVEFFYVTQASSGTVTTVFEDPALKLGTDSTYSKF